LFSALSLFFASSSLHAVLFKGQKGLAKTKKAATNAANKSEILLKPSPLSNHEFILLIIGKEKPSGRRKWLCRSAKNYQLCFIYIE